MVQEVEDDNIENPISVPTTPTRRAAAVKQPASNTMQKMTISSIMKMNKNVRDKILAPELIEKIA